MKRIFFFIILVITTLPATKTHCQPDRPRVAVVLSGGGAKGVAHISMLRAIEEAGIPIDIVCGTSMGALVGGLYAVGWSPDEIDSLVRAQNWMQLLSDRVPPSQLTLDQRRRYNSYTILRSAQFGQRNLTEGGAIQGYNLGRLFNQIYAGYEGDIDFRTLPIAFGCVATNLADGTEVDFTHGDLKQALRSSMAIPGVFTPVKTGDMLLVDGGLLNNMPVDLARKMGADVVIAVSVQNNSPTIEEMSDAISVLMRITDFSAIERFNTNVASTDLMVQVDVEGYSAASFTSEAIDTLLARGQQAADENRNALIQLRQQMGIDSCARPSTLHRHPATTSYVEQHHLSREGLTIGVGLRFDTEDLGAILVGLHIPLNTKHPSALDLNVRLGKALKAGIAFSSTSLPYPSVEYGFMRNDIDLYLRGSRILNMRYIHNQASIYPLRAKLRAFDMMMGMRFDYYNYYSGLLSSIPGLIMPNSEYFISYCIKMSQNSENHWYYPTRGMRTQLASAYSTDNLIGLDHQVGMLELSGNYRFNLPLGSRLTAQPMVYGRILLGEEYPLILNNILQGEWFGHNYEQVMPFAGVLHTEMADRYFMATQLQLQYRMWNNHYLLLRGAAAFNVADPELVKNYKPLWGAELAYSHNSIFGPLELRVGYTNLTKRASIFLSLGHEF